MDSKYWKLGLAFAAATAMLSGTTTFALAASNPTVQVMKDSSGPTAPTGDKYIAINSGSYSTQTMPVLVWNGMEYWALSHTDNDVGMDIVETNSAGKIVGDLQVTGDRYISSIVVNPTNQTVTFEGQYYLGGYSPGITLTYAQLVTNPLVQALPEVPLAGILPVAGLGALGLLLIKRRRK